MSCTGQKEDNVAKAIAKIITLIKSSAELQYLIEAIINERTPAKESAILVTALPPKKLPRATHNAPRMTKVINTFRS